MIRFINELGAEMTLEVREFERDDVQYVTYRITGPTSTAEHTLTAMEANWLHTLLCP